MTGNPDASSLPHHEILKLMKREQPKNEPLVLSDGLQTIQFLRNVDGTVHLTYETKGGKKMNCMVREDLSSQDGSSVSLQDEKTGKVFSVGFKGILERTETNHNIGEFTAEETEDFNQKFTPNFDEDPGDIQRRNELEKHGEKLTLPDDESAALLPDLNEDPQERVDAIAHQQKVIKEMEILPIISGSKNTTVHVKRKLPPKTKNSIKLSDQVLEDEQILEENNAIEEAAYVPEEQERIDKKIAKKGYDVASETGKLKHGLGKQVAEGVGNILTNTADAVTNTMYRGKTVATEKGKWAKTADKINSGEDEALTSKTAKRDAKETDRLRKQIHQEGFDQDSETITLPKSPAITAVEAVGDGLGKILNAGEKAIFEGKTITLPEEDNTTQAPKKNPSFWKRILGRT